jgi:hypothetical protein
MRAHPEWFVVPIGACQSAFAHASTHVLFLGVVQLLFVGNLPAEWVRLNRPLMYQQLF